MHHSAADQDLRGNRWFEGSPHLCLVRERRAMRRLFEEHGVLAVFNGHLHWNHLDVIRGIPYVTLQSLIENLDDDAPGRAAARTRSCGSARSASLAGSRAPSGRGTSSTGGRGAESAEREEVNREMGKGGDGWDLSPVSPPPCELHEKFEGMLQPAPADSADVVSAARRRPGRESAGRSAQCPAPIVGFRRASARNSN